MRGRVGRPGDGYPGRVTGFIRFVAVVGTLVLVVMALAVTLTALVLVVAPAFVHR